MFCRHPRSSQDSKEFLSHAGSHLDFGQADAEALTRFPPGSGGQLSDDMAMDVFGHLTDGPPLGDEVEALRKAYEAEKDPTKKLAAWKAYRHAKTETDCANKDERAESIRATTYQELEEEAAALGSPSVKSIEKLERRKQREFEIECRYNLNLSQCQNNNIDGQVQSQGQPWEESELDRLDGLLSLIPQDHINTVDGMNRGTSAFRKSNNDWIKIEGIGGQTLGHEISIYNSSFNRNNDGRVNGNKDRLSGLSGRVGLMEETTAHEIGHSVQHANKDPYEAFINEAGWKTHDRKKPTLDNELMNSLDQERKEYKERQAQPELQEQQESNYPNGKILSGRHYVPDLQYQSEYHSFEENRVPTGKRWSYARTDPGDYFAETYAQSILSPETLYDDMMKEPAGQLEKAKAKYARKPTPENQARLAEAQERADALAAQHRIMRQKVHGLSDDAVQQAYADIERLAAGASDQKAAAKALAEFKDSKEKVMTPKQLELLSARCRQDLSSSHH